jgi:hypothetical protein
LVLYQDQEPWIKEIKDWMLNGAECKTSSTISDMKTYWRNQIFIKDDLPWVWIKVRRELPSVAKSQNCQNSVSQCLVYRTRRKGQNQIQDSPKLLVAKHGGDHSGLHQEL